MTTRLFVAIELPEDIQDELAAQGAGVPGARWLDEDQLHLTLRFIGEVDGVKYRDVVAMLGRLRFPPFDLSLFGAGYFPPRGPTRSLWIGVERSEELERLHRAIDTGLTRLGLPPDRKRYVPHVTVARCDGTSAGQVGKYVMARALYRSRRFEVNAVHLFSSRLNPKGSVYELEESFDLAAGV
ncbi:MAG: RNA 2',3'-cyclic phosphodiesterase [Myxococcales bacterium]|nr:RNA 2',3'-cyclic phosphodiesterase [Myxococcales bacterium]MCB9733777.1 RNA 2',3'-cyclic phosphodiesterase [Deltaproteobacteria bacterium]